MKRIISLILMLTAVMCLDMEAKVNLPSILSDGMVLQRDKPICIWGNADSRESFIICWQGKSHIIESGEDGTWSAELPECGPGGPYEMTIGDIVLKDILVGDVFLCSGQSNMELPVRRVTDMFADEISAYEESRIRQYSVPQVYDFNSPQEDTPASSWKPCTQENVMEFSALAYFFAKEIFRQTGVPVGIVNSSWGGTPVEAWISEEALKDFPKHINEKRLYEDSGYRHRIKLLEGENFHHWNTTLHKNDPGLNEAIPWFAEEYDDSSWKETGMFSDEWGNDGLNPQAGSHWMRKDFTVPSSMSGKAAVLRLGCIVDSDSVYVNGHFVGSTGYQYPPRIYTIPSGILHEGVNNVTVRIVSNGGQPSFVPEKPYKIISGDQEITLEGTWRYRLGTPMPAAPEMMFFHYKPVCLYNAMIHPVRKFGYRAVLWYQGESNVGRWNEYAALLTQMTGCWRKAFNDEDLPFYIVELADFLHEDDVSGREAWARMREEQARAVSMNRHTRLIRNSDLGEWNDIHPLDKKTLGKRAAEAVLKDIRNN